ncbi:hypothetical protein MKK69_13925 [Methylobacterium sp. J-026]|uniref:hypothetical protein n=1 Tax=Methylobacterium sp. J-026 TaxID=2836624 RepID=UPI001FB8827C|nr:hypothetical protein [Methylobacterium sp. J-026]MCJ2135139.1 hypothetical protein [Methylobacterium sp. J-026]
MEQSRRIASDQSGAVLAATEPTTDGAMSQGKVVVLTSLPTAAKWSGLLDRVRGAAEYIRAVEDRAQDYEGRVQDLVEQVRADLRDADAKVRAAEQRTDEAEAQAAIQIRAAEERARIAEERAALAEEWLRRISETIEAEFVMAPADSRRTAVSAI